MTNEQEYYIIKKFIISVINVPDWVSAILKIDIQPEMLGFTGDAFLKNGMEISLETRPTQELKESIRKLFLKTAVDEETKWNFMEFEVKKDGSFSIKYIWDQEYQDKVDEYGKQEKELNPSYNLPKWHWEE